MSLCGVCHGVFVLQNDFPAANSWCNSDDDVILLQDMMRVCVQMCFFLASNIKMCFCEEETNTRKIQYVSHQSREPENHQ